MSSEWRVGGLARLLQKRLRKKFILGWAVRGVKWSIVLANTRGLRGCE